MQHMLLSMYRTSSLADRDASFTDGVGARYLRHLAPHAAGHDAAGHAGLVLVLYQLRRGHLTSTQSSCFFCHFLDDGTAGTSCHGTCTPQTSRKTQFSLFLATPWLLLAVPLCVDDSLLCSKVFATNSASFQFPAYRVGF